MTGEAASWPELDAMLTEQDQADAGTGMSGSDWVELAVGLVLGSFFLIYEVRNVEPVSRRVLRLLRTAGQPSEMP